MRRQSGLPAVVEFEVGAAECGILSMAILPEAIFVKAGAFVLEGFPFLWSFRLPLPGMWAVLIYLSFVGDVGLAFFGWMVVGPE